MSRDFLKTLKTEVLTDQKGRPLRHTRNMTHVLLQSRGPQRSSTEATVSRMEHDYHMSPQMNTRSSFVSDSPSSLFRTGITGTGPIESRTSFLGRKLRYSNFFFPNLLTVKSTVYSPCVLYLPMVDNPYGISKEYVTRQDYSHNKIYYTSFQ